MESFSKILVSIDGSADSKKAADYALSLSKKYGSGVILLHVLTEKISYEYDRNLDNTELSNSVKENILEKHIQEAESWFNVTKQSISQDNNININTKIIIKEKSIAEDIINYAEKNSIDLIVLGTRGRTGLKKTLLGSIASSVVTHAHCPVLIIR